MSTVPLYVLLYRSLYFACVTSTALYSVTCMQSFFYYVHYQNDPLRTKYFVALLWALNTTHEALVIYAYKYIMGGLVNPLAFLRGNPELITLFTVLVALLTQGFSVHRIYALSGKYIVVPLIWTLLAIIQLVSAIIYTGRALYAGNGKQVDTSTELVDHSSTRLLTLSISVATGADVLIAISLTFLFLRERTATAFTSTAHTLQRLTVFAVNTGIWPAAFAILTITSLYLFPLDLLFTVFGFPFCSVYCNTLLANLNARSYARGEVMTHDIGADLFTSSSSPVSNSTERRR